MIRDDYYSDMKPLAMSAVGYVQREGEEEPSDLEVSVWVNDTWFSEEEPRRTVISIEGYCGTTEFGFELTADECSRLSDIIWTELLKRKRG